MITFIKTVEFLLLVIIFCKIIQIFFPEKRKKTVVYSSNESKRFDGKGSDISDADYKDIR